VLKNLLSPGTGDYVYLLGIAAGDVVAGYLPSSPNRAGLTMLVFLLMTLVSTFCYLGSTGITPEKFIALCFFMGVRWVIGQPLLPLLPSSLVPISALPLPLLFPTLCVGLLIPISAGL
jgi:hypothetical protein